MSDYLSIGKVSKLKNVSIKSLRYYDEIGIFKPAYINTSTNYRYYTTEQLPYLDAISLCVEVGIPLKNFANYKDNTGNVDMRKLLWEGKILAENKIKSMSGKLENLSHTIACLESENAHAIFPNRFLKQRDILLIPYDENTSSTSYSHKLLELFVTAQRSGISVSYPSGLLYKYYETKVEKYVFITVDFLPQNKNTLPKNCILYMLPKGYYAFKRHKDHSIEDAPKIFHHLLNTQKEYELIETDLLSTNDVEKLELQLLIKEL